MTIKDKWLEHPRVDAVLGSVGLLAPLIPSSQDILLAAGGAVAATSGVLLGMASVVYGLFQQSTAPRIQTIRALYHRTLRRNWVAILIGFVASCGLSIGGIFVASCVPLASAVVGVSAVFMLARAARMTWLLNLYLHVDEAESNLPASIRQDIASR